MRGRECVRVRRMRDTGELGVLLLRRFCPGGGQDA